MFTEQLTRKCGREFNLGHIEEARREGESASGFSILNAREQS